MFYNYFHFLLALSGVADGKDQRVPGWTAAIKKEANELLEVVTADRLACRNDVELRDQLSVSVRHSASNWTFLRSDDEKKKVVKKVVKRRNRLSLMKSSDRFVNENEEEEEE